MITSGALLYYGEPKTQRIAIAFLMEVQEAGLASFDIKISGVPLARDVILAVRDYFIEKTEQPHEYVGATAGDIDLVLKDDGCITFSYRLQDGDWEIIRELRIKRKQPPEYLSAASFSPSSTISTATMT
ncbi:MAG: hypothetical protein K2P94_10430, partial [Rhodospirillaceae bacterium]|nr:hypothetical protein [Rhodospirillaceae bacterium]